MRPDPYSLIKLIFHEDEASLAPLVTPRVNMNGNGKQDLVDQLIKVKHSLEEADFAFVKASDVVHGRNFQTIAFDREAIRNAAEDAWRERRIILQAMAAEIYALAIDISNQ